VSDVSEPFAPFPTSHLGLSPVDDKERIEAFLDWLIETYYVESRKNLPFQTC